MRNVGKNASEVIEHFIKGTGECSRNSGGNIFYTRDMLYSYGPHFRLALRVSEDIVLINGDRYSSTTSGHQAGVRREASGAGYTVSDGILPQGIQHRGTLEAIQRGLLGVIAVTPDSTKKVDEYEVATARAEGYTVTKSRFDGVLWSHRAGMCLLQVLDDEEMGTAFNLNRRGDAAYIPINLGDRLIMGMDDGSYFLALLPAGAHPRTCMGALESLRPEPPTGWTSGRGVDELWGGTPCRCVRQGEWFFYGVNTPTRKLSRLETKVIDRSPAQPESVSRGTNVHTARELRTDDKGNVYARGCISHSAGDHPRLNLKEQWHIVRRNTARRSWSAAAGGFDVD